MRKFLMGAALLGAVACGEAGENEADEAMEAPAAEAPAATEAMPAADSMSMTADSTMNHAAPDSAGAAM